MAEHWPKMMLLAVLVLSFAAASPQTGHASDPALPSDLWPEDPPGPGLCTCQVVCPCASGPQQLVAPPSAPVPSCKTTSVASAPRTIMVASPAEARTVLVPSRPQGNGTSAHLLPTFDESPLAGDFWQPYGTGPSQQGTSLLRYSPKPHSRNMLSLELLADDLVWGYTRPQTSSIQSVIAVRGPNGAPVPSIAQQGIQHSLAQYLDLWPDSIGVRPTTAPVGSSEKLPGPTASWSFWSVQISPKPADASAVRDQMIHLGKFSFEDLALVLQGTQQGLMLSAAALAIRDGPATATPGSPHPEDSTHGADAPTVHDGTPTSGDSLIGVPRTSIPAPGPGPTPVPPLAPVSNATQPSISSKIANWWKGLPAGTRQGYIIAGSVILSILVISVAVTLICFHCGHRDDSMPEEGGQADQINTGEKAAGTASQKVQETAKARNKGPTTQQQGESAQQKEKAMGGGPGSNAKVFANGLAKNAHKAAKDSTEHTQAEPSKAAEQRHTISQMLKDRTTKALHLLRSMQAGSAKGAAEDLKSAIIGYMMFADGMVQTLPKMPTDISEIFASIVTEEIGKAIGSKSGYSSVAIALQDHRDDCAQLYQAARSAADKLWGSLQKARDRATADIRASQQEVWAQAQTARGVMEKAIIAVEKDLMTTYESATASAKRRWADINAELSIEP